MKNFPLLLFALSFLPICSAYEYPPPPVYPVAPSGPEFQKEAEAFVTARAVYMPDSEIKERLRKDSRDWEPALEKLIRESSVHGITVSAFAFAYSAYRGTAGDPKIVAATGEFFDRHVEEALVRYDKYSQEGKPTHPSVAGTFPSVSYEILKVGSAAHLTRVLDYLNSPADEKIRLIDRNTPQAVAAALRSYGDGTHVKAAENFAKRLRENGKADIAEDIDRSIQRIEKGGKQGDSSGIAASNIANEKNTGSPESQMEYTSPPWIIGSIIAGITLIFVIFKIIRRRSPR